MEQLGKGYSTISVVWSTLMITSIAVINIGEYDNIDDSDAIYRCKSYHKVIENIDDYKLCMTPYVMNNQHSSCYTSSYVVLNEIYWNISCSKILEYQQYGVTGAVEDSNRGAIR